MIPKLAYGLRGQPRASLGAEALKHAIAAGVLVIIQQDDSEFCRTPLSDIPCRSAVDAEDNWLAFLGHVAISQFKRIICEEGSTRAPSDVLMCVDLLLHPEGREYLPVPMYGGRSITSAGL